METFLAMMPEIFSATAAEAGTAAVADAAATGLGEAALTDAALTTLPEAAAATLPEVATATLPEVATTTLPEVATAAAPETTGIMQAGNVPSILQGTASASPESIQAAELTADVPDAASTVTSATEGVSPYTPAGTDLSNLSTKLPEEDAIMNGSYTASNQAATPDLRTFSGPSSTAAADTAGGYSAGPGSVFEQGWKSASDLFTKGTDWVEAHPKSAFAIGLTGAKIYDALNKNGLKPPEKYHGLLSKYHLASNPQRAEAVPNYYTPSYQQAAQGGIMSLAMGGPATTPQPGQMYPQSQQDHTQFAVPSQMPTSAEIVNAGYEPQTNPYTGSQPLGMAMGGSATTSNPLIDIYKKQINPDFKEAPTADTGIHEDTDADTRLQDALAAANTRAEKIDYMTKARPFKAQSLTPGLDKQKQLAQAQQQAVQAAGGGIMGYSLGGYAAGGREPRLLKGPGDGMSDNIPATIADRQPARLADGEFVVPADVVSHLGNGSTDAGAKHLHKMMDKVRVARTGKKAQGTQINPNKYLPK